MKISKRTYRQIKNLEQKCTFDTENKVAHIPLHYASPDDLLDEHLSWPDKPVVSDEAMDYLRDIVSVVPDMFSVEISLTVDDYGIYTHDQLMDALRVTIENTYYYHDEKRRQTNVLSVFFIIIGFLTLTVEVMGGTAGWLGEKGSMVRSIVETLLDVMTWVFLWEGCALLLLTYENESTIFSREMQRFHKVNFMNADGKLLVSMDKNRFYEGWVQLGKREAFARGYILFSNAILLASLILHIVRFFASKHMLIGVDVVVQVANWVLILLLVISNASFYLDKGKLKNCALALSVVTLVFNVLSSALFSARLLSNTMFMVFNGIFILGLILNIICVVYMKKQMVEI